MSEQAQPEQSGPPTGTISLNLSIEVPVEAIVSGWTREEVAELLAGSEEAREELICQAASRRDRWSGFDVDEADITVEGRRL